MALFHPSVSASSAPAAPDRATELLIGLLVPPVLLGIVVARTLADGLTQAGLASEQWFAGERLPNLNMPSTPSDPATTSVAGPIED